MHPIKNLVTGKEEDLTPKFKAKLLLICKAADEAKKLADCTCPYAAEAKMSEILALVREAYQVVNSLSDYFQIAVPVTPWKKEHITKCWE